MIKITKILMVMLMAMHIFASAYPEGLKQKSSFVDCLSLVQEIKLDVSKSLLKPKMIRGFSELQDYFLIIGKNYVIYLYEKKGTFLQNFNGLGKGPGEYTEISDVAVLENNKFVVFDNARMIVNIYEIKNNKVAYYDFMDISSNNIYNPSFFKDRSGYIAIVQPLSNKDYRIAVLDNDFKIINRFSKNWNQSDAKNIEDSCVSKDFIALLDVPKFKSGTFVRNSNRLFIYTKNGKQHRVIKYKDNKAIAVYADYSNNIVFISGLESVMHVYDMNTGKYLAEITNDYPSEKGLYTFYYFDNHKMYAYAELPDKKIKMTIFEIKLQ